MGKHVEKDASFSYYVFTKNRLCTVIISYHIPQALIITMPCVYIALTKLSPLNTCNCSRMLNRIFT